MATKSATRKQTEITAPAIFRVSDKATGKCLGYGVPSDSEPGTTYFVTWNAEKHCYDCTCKGGQCANCKHRRAVTSVLAAKKEIARERNIGSFFEALATFAQDEMARQAVAEAEQIATAPTPTPEPQTSVAPAPKPVAVATGKPIISKVTAPLRGSQSIGFSQMKNVPAPRKLAAIPMR